VLNTGATVVVDVLLNLGFSTAICGFVNRHLNVFIKIGNNNRAECRVLSMEHLVIDGPEAVEIEHFLVPGGSGFHLTIGLVSNAMVHGLKFGAGHKIVHHFLKVVGLESREEGALVVDTLNEGVDGIAVSFDGSNNYGAIVVFQSFGLTNALSAALDSLCINTSGIINAEGDILDTVTVLGVMGGELGVVGVEGALESKNDIAIANNVSAPVAGSSLKALSKSELAGRKYLLGRQCIRSRTWSSRRRRPAWRFQPRSGRGQKSKRRQWRVFRWVSRSLPF